MVEMNIAINKDTKKDMSSANVRLTLITFVMYNDLELLKKAFTNSSGVGC